MLKNKLEALLFSSGRKMGLDELVALTRSKLDDVTNSLKELKKEHDEKNSSVMVVNEGDFWKLTVREEFLPLVQKIVTETELSKTIMETLAVIAFKYPIKQSDLIKIRTNKAYDHLKELEELGYISRQKFGRTNLIKLTQKFFEYFDLPEQKLKDHFTDFSSIAKAIEEKESEIEKIKQEQKAQAEEENEKSQEVDLVDDKNNKIPLNTYKSENKDKKSDSDDKEDNTRSKQKLGNLDIVDEPSEEEQQEERERIQKIKDEDKPQQEEENNADTDQDSKEEKQEIEDIPKDEQESDQEPKEKLQDNEIEDSNLEETEKSEQDNNIEDSNIEEEKTEKENVSGIKVTPEMQQEIDKKVEKMLHTDAEKEQDPSTEESEPEEIENKEEESKEKDLLEASMEEKDKEDQK